MVKPHGDTLLAGRYQLEGLIGKGGMGEVHRARDQVLQRSVAVKVLKSEYAHDKVTLERFRREALIAASLSHPAIAQVLDFEENGKAFIVMELLEGKDLDKVLNEEGVLAPEKALLIISEAAEALAHAHENSAVHRDVKPGNIFLTDSGAVKVTDFGIATAAAHSPLTATGELIGTPLYLSPEQVQGEPATGKSDIYALGCVLFQMVTGSPPFQADTKTSIAMAHVNAPVPKASVLNPDVPADVDAVIERAMAKDPQKRFSSAGEMAAELRGARADETQVLVVPAADGLPVGDTQVMAGPATVDEQAPAPRGPAGRRLGPSAAVGLLAAGLLVLFFIAKACGTENKAGPSQGTPGQSSSPSPSQSGLLKVANVTNLRLEEAEQRLRAQGLEPRVTARIPATTSGIVVAQTPGPGQTAWSGQVVGLTITELSETSDDGDGDPGAAGNNGGNVGGGEGKGKDKDD